MGNWILLCTKDGGEVVALDPAFDPAIYLMLASGKRPDAIMWGARLFIADTDDPYLYTEGFVSAAFTLVRETKGE